MKEEKRLTRTRFVLFCHEVFVLAEKKSEQQTSGIFWFRISIFSSLFWIFLCFFYLLKLLYYSIDRNALALHVFEFASG